MKLEFLNPLEAPTIQRMTVLDCSTRCWIPRHKIQHFRKAKPSRSKVSREKMVVSVGCARLPKNAVVHLLATCWRILDDTEPSLCSSFLCSDLEFSLATLGWIIFTSHYGVISRCQIIQCYHAFRWKLTRPPVETMLQCLLNGLHYSLGRGAQVFPLSEALTSKLVSVTKWSTVYLHYLVLIIVVNSPVKLIKLTSLTSCRMYWT